VLIIVVMLVFRDRPVVVMLVFTLGINRLSFGCLIGRSNQVVVALQLLHRLRFVIPLLGGCCFIWRSIVFLALATVLFSDFLHHFF
jgi:hypothetical protein